MKINSKFIKALKSSQLVLMYLYTLVVFILQLFYPDFSAWQFLVGAIFAIILVALIIASGFVNETEIFSRKTKK